MVARRPRRGRLGVRSRRSSAPAEAGGGCRPSGVCRRAVLRRGQRRLAARLGRRLRVQRRRHASTTACRRSIGSPIRTTKSFSSTTDRATPPARLRARPSACARDRHAERRLERGAQRRAGGSDRRDRCLHRRRHAGRSRLADVSRSAVPHLGRRRPRADPTSSRPTIPHRAVHRARARRTDARAARRSHRRARARLQHGVPARRAAGHRRLQSRSISAPATMWTCAGGCRRGAGESASPPPPSSGTTTGRRSTAYWRQQVGYGEGETWLMAHHPDKFLDGRLLWRGRIYSPLPFVRSLWGTNASTPASGARRRFRRSTAPTSIPSRSCRTRSGGRSFRSRWRCPALVVAGLARTNGPAALLLGSGIVGLAVTIAKNLAYALRSDVASLPGQQLWYRVTVAYLHFIQPLARVRGRIRGMLAPPAIALPAGRAADESRTEAVAPRGVSARCCCSPAPSPRIASGAKPGRQPIACCRELTDWLRRSRAVRSIEIDDGWSDDRDVSVFVGRWAWLDVRALAEDHGAGKHAGARQHAASADELSESSRRIGLGAGLLIAAAAGLSLRWPLAGVATAALTLSPHRHHGLAHGADDGDHAARRRPRALAQHMVRMPSGRRGADHLPVPAAHLRSAQRADLRRHDRRHRRRHVHAPAKPQAPVRLVIGTRDGSDAADRRSRPGSTRPAASPSRRTATSTSPTRTTTSSTASIGELGVMTFVGNRSERLLRRRRAGDQRAARHAGRRGHRPRRRSDRRRLA